MRYREIVNEDLSRRSFLKGMGGSVHRRISLEPAQTAEGDGAALLKEASSEIRPSMTLRTR